MRTMGSSRSARFSASKGMLSALTNVNQETYRP
jgi:hypothetical protein